MNNLPQSPPTSPLPPPLPQSSQFEPQPQSPSSLFDPFKTLLLIFALVFIILILIFGTLNYLNILPVSKVIPFLSFLPSSSQTTQKPAEIFAPQVQLPEQRSTATPSVPQLPPGFKKAQEIKGMYPEFVIRIGARVFLTGTLTQIDPGKSWTIEQNGKTLTLENEGGTIRYLQSSPDRRSLPQEIGPENIKIGDNVTIVIFIDNETGTQSVQSITLNASSQ